MLLNTRIFLKDAKYYVFCQIGRMSRLQKLANIDWDIKEGLRVSRLPKGSN